MRRLLQFITIGLFLSALLSAQEHRSADDPMERLRREFAFRELDMQRSDIEREIELRRNARRLERQFMMKANRFVELWCALVNEYNSKRVFNIKLAAEVSKAFHDVENSEGWLKRK
jgi:hypothetical protein